MPPTVDVSPAQPAAELLARFQAGQRGALARLLTYAENNNPLADEALDAIFRETGQALVLGVTGPPGAGKSTLTNALIRALRQRGKTVGVIAIDPSSALSGGAALGDRIRMLETYDDDGVYIRSMAARGQHGGLALATGRATHLLDAFGFNMIIIETVGVGQDELDVVAAADTTLLLQVPGLGDSVQTIKAGILEVADVIVVNKADLPEARTLARDLRAMLRLRGQVAWLPPVVEAVSTTGEGLDRLLDQVERHSDYLEHSGELERRRERRLANEVERMARRQLETELLRILAEDNGGELLLAVHQRRISPRNAARQLVRRLRCAPGESEGIEDAV